MQKSGAITAAAMLAAKAVIRPGVTTKQIDRAVHAAILSHGRRLPSWGTAGSRVARASA